MDLSGKIPAPYAALAADRWSMPQVVTPAQVCVRDGRENTRPFCI